MLRHSAKPGWCCVLLACVATQAGGAAPVGKAAAHREPEAETGKAVQKKLASGVEYRVIKAGSGKRPKLGDTVVVRFEARTLGGKEVDVEAAAQPLRVQINRAMPAWRQVLPLMKEGAQWEIRVPPGLGYTRLRGRTFTRSDPSLTTQTLKFELELVEVAPRSAPVLSQFARRSASRSGANLPQVYVYLMDAQDSPLQEGGSREGIGSPQIITTESLSSGGEGREAPPAAAAPPHSDTSEATAGAANAAQQADHAPAQTAAAGEGEGEQKDSSAQADAAGSESFAAVESTLPGGIRYREISKGSGAPPARTDLVTVHYRSRMASGVEFDSSYGQGEPVTFRLNEAIRGWQEALLRMKPGARWELHVPADYGYRQPGRLAGQALDFDIELLSVSRAGEPAAAPEAGEAIPPIVLDSGLAYQILESGGGLAPVSGENISIRYRAVPADADDSEATWQRRDQVTLAFDALPAEWRAAIGRMEEGARWKFRVPAPLAERDPWWSGQRDGLMLEVELLAVTAQTKPLLSGAAQTARAEDRPEVDGEGMIELAGGLRYRELKPGTGAAGGDYDSVTVRYQGAVQSAGEKQQFYHFEGEAHLQPARLDETWREVIGPMRAGTRWRLELQAQELPVLWRPSATGAAVMELELDGVKGGEDANSR